MNMNILNRASFLHDRIDDLRFNKFKSYKLLPYANDLPKEAENLLAEIKANLGRAVLFNEPLPGCYLWLNNLCNYIKIYGLAFSKEEHILLIKLLYELLTGTEIPSDTTCISLYVLIRLLKKKKLISPDDLQLPWRPLYNITLRITETDKVHPDMYRFPPYYEEGIEMLIPYVKNYFPLSATQEILDELKPTLLCSIRGMTLAHKVEVLKCFLPLQLPPQHHSVGHQLWFEEFMELRELCQNGHKCHDDFIEVMAALATNNIGYINWEPHIPLMFTRFIRSLRLPVSYNKLQVKHDDVDPSSMTLWITAVLGHGSSAQMHLEKFLKTIETYFHPANSGCWMVKLTRILVKLSHHFITRLYKERYAEPTWETPVPEEYKLTESDVDAFVKCMLPVTMIAIFNKMSVIDATETLQNLATMRPNLVIPYVLDRVSYTLDSATTESHKLIATLNCMQAIARPLARGFRIVNQEYCYAEGPTHIVPLLSLILPSIDPNTPEKCFLALRLISVYACLIPIVDTSRPITTINEEDRLDYDIVSGFEEFVLQFLDKIFYFIDNSSLELVRLENSAGGEKSKLEKFAEIVLYHVCRVLLMQLNETIFADALDKLRTFIIERTLEIKVAGQLTVSLCQVFARVNGKQTLRALLPVLSQTIMDIIGESNDIVREEHLDARLLHAMLLLSGIVDTTGNNLLPHIDILITILDRVVILKSIEGNNLACRLLSTIFRSLCTMMPYEFTSTINIEYWGQVLHTDTIKVKWYKPGKEEMAVINRMFVKYLIPETKKLEEYCKDSTTLTREELLASINIMCSVIEGCESILPVWEGKPLNLMKSSIECTSFKPTLGVEEEILMPDGSHVKRYIQLLASKLHDVILENVEADTKCLVSLTKVWCSLFSECESYMDFARVRYKNIECFQRRMKDMLIRKKGVMACFVLQHAEGQQIMRLCSRVSTLNETHKEIILKFVSLVTRRSTASLGCSAKSILISIFHQLPYSWKIIVPKLCDTLKMDPETDENAYEGALSIFLSLIVNQFITKDDWSTIRDLLSAMVLSKPSEKLSIIRLKENIVKTIASELATVPIKHEIPSTCFKIATALWETEPRPNSSIPDENSCMERFVVTQQLNENNLTSYNGLINDLLNVLLTENLHWRRSLMAIDFIEYMVHPEQIYSPKVVRYFLGTLIHDSFCERDVALRVVINILEQQKRKHPKITIDPPSIGNDIPLEERSIRNMLGPRPDNNWLQYNYETRPLTAEQWDAPRFVHRPFVGYFVWPKKIEIYAPSSQQPSLDPNRDMTDQEKEIVAFFNDVQNIEKLIKYYSLEMKKDKDKFAPFKCLLFKNLFRNHGIVFLKHFLPHLRKLVTDKQESSQRCAAELICGIIKGSKHWPFDMVSEMWDSLLPIVRLALANMTPETTMDWVRCFSEAQLNRDPNRHHWLLECLMEEICVGESESSFVECGRLLTLQTVLGIQSWRVLELLQRLLRRIEDRLFANPFENVRERLSTSLVIVFNSSTTNFNTVNNLLLPRIQDFIDKIIPKLQPLVNEKAAELNKNAEIAPVSVESDESNGLRVPGMNEEEKEKAIRLLKTMCKWVLHMNHVWYGLPTELYQIFPIIYQMENYEADDELRKLCTTALTVYTQAFTVPSSMPIAVEAVDKMSRHASWWTRYSCLEFIQAWVFYNMGIFLSNPTWVTFVEETVLRLLEDDRVEVRKHAGKVLSGLVHCTFIPDQERLLDEFKKRAKTKLYKKDRSKNGGQNSLKTDALRIRHAAIIGMCAFVQAHPYDIPKYIPPIFEYLSPHMNDPQPIPMTIKKTLDDFRRTHEGWKRVKEYMQHFTEEQITALQDLTMPPSHYA
ncbi:proteasome activator complex subunit 4A-like [Ceratina calcarata]|uniref:Proteasome activator complex subunit 4A-like n=1 Tax=Ceratina calcarata TaxID=156304 RepID=A0AAJ7IVV0_9HYME|nr:proteasome activator complex subunit 4A-like [Ceratina calcarata]XP_017877827.1 proteasome activator complex subunit 4A-like [Ceratina calcarata]